MASVRGLAAVATLGTLMLASQAGAVTISLGFDSLPSAQGWTYVATGTGTGVAESAIYDATGVGLTQNSVGLDIGAEGGNFYQRSLSLTPFQPFSLTMVARVGGIEGSGGAARLGFSFGLSTTEGLYQFGLGRDGFARVISATDVQTGSYVGQAYDPDVFNTFRISRGAGSVVFAVNDVVLQAFESSYNLGVDRLFFGDMSGRGNARADIQSFNFTTGRSTIVPEPATWALMIGGFTLVGGAVRRTRRFAQA